MDRTRDFRAEIEKPRPLRVFKGQNLMKTPSQW